jgi:hypothetical protein
VNLNFSLRALAAQKLRRERKTRCRLAAGGAAIRASRGIDKIPNLHIADEVVFAPFRKEVRLQTEPTD